VARAVGRPSKFEVSAALQDPVEDGLGEVRIVEHAAPGGQRLVGGEDHRPPMQMAVVDDLEEDVGGIGAVAEVADLVDHQHVGVGVSRAARGAACRPASPATVRR